jgi:hypothetical protein
LVIAVLALLVGVVLTAVIVPVDQVVGAALPKWRQPVVSPRAEPGMVSEGQPLVFIFTLSTPAPAGGLVVRLGLLRDTDPLPGDVQYNVAGSEGITSFELLRGPDGSVIGTFVGIAAGATSAKLVNLAIADYVAEEPESAVFALAVGDGYSIDAAQNAASYTLQDAWAR